MIHNILINTPHNILHIQRLYSPNTLTSFISRYGLQDTTTQMIYNIPIINTLQHYDNNQHVNRFTHQIRILTSSTSRYGLQETNTQMVHTFQLTHDIHQYV